MLRTRLLARGRNQLALSYQRQVKSSLMKALTRTELAPTPFFFGGSPKWLHGRNLNTYGLPAGSVRPAMNLRSQATPFGSEEAIMKARDGLLSPLDRQNPSQVHHELIHVIRFGRLFLCLEQNKAARILICKNPQRRRGRSQFWIGPRL